MVDNDGKGLALKLDTFVIFLMQRRFALWSKVWGVTKEHRQDVTAGGETAHLKNPIIPFSISLFLTLYTSSRILVISVKERANVFCHGQSKFQVLGQENK